MDLVLRRCRIWPSVNGDLRDVRIEGERVAAVDVAGGASPEATPIDLGGRWLLPAFVNAHDHLDSALLPPLGRPPYGNGYEFRAAAAEAVDRQDVRAAIQCPLTDRHLMGGLRNLLAGCGAVVHHGPWHRSLGRADFPVRVQGRYSFARSCGENPALRKTYRTTDRRIPWFTHLGEGTDARSRGEVEILRAANLVRQNTVLVHALGVSAEELPRLAEAGVSVVWCPEADLRLFGATLDVTRVLAAGVRVGLGSEGAEAGPRDALSNLAAARAAANLSDEQALALATEGSAEVARLPVGGFSVGAVADFLATPSIGALLAGDRRAIDLVVVAGRVRYGSLDLWAQVGSRWAAWVVDGVQRGLDESISRRAVGILSGLRLRGADPLWMRGVSPAVQAGML